LGPKGTGLLYIRKDALEVIAAQWVGAYSNTGNFDLRTGEFHLHPSAQRYEYGTVSVPLFAGLGAAMDFLLRIGIENIWLRNASLAAALQEGLSQLGAEMLSPQNPGERSAMITFRLKNIETSKLQTFLAQEFKLRTRGVSEAGLNGLRISLHLYNSLEEVESILAGVRTAQRL
jgi:selenocysteine lyase/cysteine desulfurase